MLASSAALITVRLSSMAALLSAGFGNEPIDVGLLDAERLRRGGVGNGR